MTKQENGHPPLRRRLLQLSAVVLIGLSLLATGLMISYSKKTADRSYDIMLNSAILQLANAVRHSDTGFIVELPISAFTILAQAPEDRVFYRISVNDTFLTGERSLPALPARKSISHPLTQQDPEFFDSHFSGEAVRVARLIRLNTEHLPHDVIEIELAQTRLAREQLGDEILYPALQLILGLLLSALLLLWLGIYYALRPFTLIARALARRGPRDLTPLSLSVPKETLPLLHTINHFIARQQKILARMESYTSVAAHQLRTPLASLRALSEMARDEPDSNKRQQRLSGLIEQCDQLSLTLNHLLNQAMIDHRFHSQDLQPVELNSLVKKVCLALAVSALRRKIELSFEPTATSFWVQGDEIALTQMLNNLLDNAVAHAPAHSQVDVIVRATPLPAIIIRDTGPGIPTDERNKVFARFYRGSQHRYRGSGLGMAIARDVAEHHGARIHLNDNQPQGLEVEVRFKSYRSTP